MFCFPFGNFLLLKGSYKIIRCECNVMSPWVLYIVYCNIQVGGVKVAVSLFVQKFLIITISVSEHL